MERALGFGGFFFKAADPEGLALWYEKHLGVTRATEKNGHEPWHEEAGPTVFRPFPRDTKMFPNTSFMLNFRVADLEKMVAQLRATGITVEVDPEHYPYGRFASLKDPEGNPIQLWQAE